MVDPSADPQRMLHVEVHPGSGPPVLLVHGFLSSRAHWTPNLAALGEVCTPVVVELLGHGRSAVPDDPGMWSPAAYVGYFEAVRRSTGADRWAVIGHSLGGALVLGYALARPEQVAAVVFTNSQSALADDEWRRRIMAQAVAQASRLRGPDGKEVLANHPMRPHRSRRVTPDIKAALVADYESLDPRGVAGTVEWTAPSSSVRDRLHQLQAPALLTVGRDEEAFAPSARFARAALPALQVAELDGGHNVNLHDPDGWNRVVVEFLNR